MKSAKQRITPEQAVAAIREHGGLRPAARALGVDNGWLCRIAKRAAGPLTGPDTVSGTIAAKPKGVKTLTDFRQAYDKDTIVPAKIKEGLAALGADGWEYEVEFAKLCGVSLYDMGRVRERFADHIVSIGRNTKRAWAGSKALAAKMREMV